MIVWVSTGLFLLVAVMVALDLGMFRPKGHALSTTEAIVWSAFWVVVTFVFNASLSLIDEPTWLDIGRLLGQEVGGPGAALTFLTGYLAEKCLSVANIVVIALIFAYLRLPLMAQQRVLIWGVLAAVLMRGVMVALGLVLVPRLPWLAYLLGGLLMLTAAKILIARHDNLEPSKNPAVWMVRRWYGVAPHDDARRFFTRLEGQPAVTPLFLALLMVATTDLVFAIDAVPAIYAVTGYPFLVITCNLFAVLGLRALYFAVAGILEKFQYMKMSLVFVLAFLGVQMLLVRSHPIPTAPVLAVLAGILAVGLVASIAGAWRDTAALASPLAEELAGLAVLTYTNVRRALIFLIGSSVLLVGLAMVVLPGPAILVIPAGLAILATEFAWARRLLRKIKDKARTLSDAVRIFPKQ